jgi:hypothetical protein
MRHTSLIALALAAATTTLAAAEPVVIVSGGKSDHVICHDAKASASVKVAAAEIQRVIRESTGAELAIVTESRPKMICVGDNAFSRAAGFSIDDLAPEGYRIATKGDCVYILGVDKPADAAGWPGGETRGTLYGSYAFLERSTGVRWLTPTDEDIRKSDKVVCDAGDTTSVPFFPSRKLGTAGYGLRDWGVRLGGGGLIVNHNHNWADFPSRQTLREHPEYLALNGDKRMAVPADDKAAFQPKFCTTNPGLVKAYADGAIAWLEKNPEQRMVSISPSDGGGWCDCPECRKYMVPGPSPQWGDYGRYKRSVTPLILKFYNDVARIVREKCPGKMVCGYVYYDFTWPPDPLPPLEPNVALMLAPLQHYGLTRYKPELRDEFERLCAGWSRASPFVGYYAASTWMRNGIGAPLGPSLPLLAHTFKTLADKRFEAVYYYSLPRDSCGVHDYLVLKLMWNPHADIDALFQEWLDRAYGPGGTAMGRLYRLIDAELAAGKQAAPLIRADYEMTSELAIQVYAKNFQTLESLYREAVSKAQTDAQRRRLADFGDNMTILHHVLAEAGLLKDAAASSFAKSPQDYAAFLAAKKDSIAVRTIQTAGNQGGITAVMPPRALSSSEPRMLAAVRLPDRMPAPILDGDLRDAAWGNAAGAEQNLAVADRFTAAGGEKPAKQQTRGLLTYDDEALYVAFRCADSDIEAADRKHDDDAIFGDDCVELFFSATPKQPGRYWHLVVNARNARWDALTEEQGPMERIANFPWESAAVQGEGFWSVEIKIPFREITMPPGTERLTGPPVGASWRVNLAREDKPMGENSSWSPVREGFLNPDEFGHVRFPR